MIAVALFPSLLCIAALLCVILRMWDQRGVERRRADMLADQIAADWTKEETDRIHRSATKAAK